MKKIIIVMLGAIAVANIPLDATAAAKCSLEQKKVNQATRDATKAEGIVERLTNDITNRSNRGDDQISRLEARVSDADGAITGGHINLAGDALACWMSQQRNCSSRTAQNAARRYASAVARLEKAKGALEAFKVSLARVLDTLTVRLQRASDQVVLKQTKQKEAEDALKACLG